MLKDSHSLSVIIAAKEQKLKNGKYKMREESRVAIEKFIKFNPTQDWMESKDYTKLGKILSSAVFFGSELINEPLRRDGKGVALYDNIIFLRVDRQWQLKDETIKLRVEKLAPLVDHFDSMKTRLTKNGKLPKEEAERRKREMIKGTLDKKLAKILMEIKEEWIKIIFKYQFEWLKDTAASAVDFIKEVNVTKNLGKNESQKLQFLVMNGVVTAVDKQYVFNTDEVYKKAATQLAKNEGESFFFKMADKLGGLVTGKYEFLDATHTTGGNTPFSSTITFEFANNTQIVLENKIVVNRSPLNNYFYQYPCTFHSVMINGEKLKNASELTTKQAFQK